MQPRQLAKVAQRDGLALYWSITYLMYKLEHMPSQIAVRERRNVHSGDNEAHSLRLESEALASRVGGCRQGQPRLSQTSDRVSISAW